MMHSLPIYMSVPNRGSWTSYKYSAVQHLQSSGFARPLRAFYYSDESSMSGLRIATLIVSIVFLVWEGSLLLLNITAIIALLKYFSWVNLLLFFYFLISTLSKSVAIAMGIIVALSSSNPSNFLRAENTKPYFNRSLVYGLLGGNMLCFIVFIIWAFSNLPGGTLFAIIFCNLLHVATSFLTGLMVKEKTAFRY